MLSDEEDETAVVNDEDEDDDEEDEEASYSSRMSNKSEKNMADFDGEDDSVCEEELAQLAERVRSISFCIHISTIKIIVRFALSG